MAIVTEAYYTSTFYGLTVASADFPQFEIWSERLILGICRLTADDFTALSTANQTAVENAICAQISYISVFGLETLIAGISSTGFTVGKVSVNSDSRFPVGKTSMICPAAYAYLEQTGLLNPQIDTRGEPFLPFWFGGGWNA